MSIFSQHSRSSGKEGFTLIELLVVMTIMAVISAVVLVRQSSFDSSTILRSLGYSVALSVRQAQVYGSSVFGTTTSGGVVQYAPAYGIHLSSGSTGSYILFADLSSPSNGKYDAGEDVKVFTFNAGYVLKDFCVQTISAGTPICASGASGLNTLDIVFRRPNPDACFYTNIAGSNVCAPGAAPVYATSSIQIQANGGGSTRSIYISSTGEISVGNSGS